MGEWKEYKLGEVAVLNYGKGLKETDRVYGSVPVYSSAGLTGWHNEPLANSKGIIIGRKGTIGKVYLTDKPFYCIDTAYYVLPNDEVYDLKFLYYLLLTLGLEYLNEDSAVPGLNRNTAYDQDILLPSLPEQKSVASILSSLDDKIDLLHRQNKTLEALAETLFRQWFIEAAPQPSPNLSQMERKNGEEAEEGWKVVKVKDVCKTITKGTTPTTLGNSFVETGVNFLKAESLTDDGDLLENKFAHIDEATHEKLSRSKLDVNDLIITIAGTIGRVAIVPERVLPANTNQALAILRLATNTISHIFLYCLFKSTEVRNDFESRVVHAVQPNLSLGEIGDISFKLPPKGKLEFGEKELELIFQKKEKNNIQIRTLTRLRDTLLPKLMSGEVRVKDMERFVERSR